MGERMKIRLNNPDKTLTILNKYRTIPSQISCMLPLLAEFATLLNPLLKISKWSMANCPFPARYCNAE